MFIDTTIEIALISMSVGIFHRVLQMKMGNQKQMKEHQENMKKSQEKIKELMTKEDEKSIKEKAELEKEMMESMSTVMKGTMKLMVVSLIVILPIFWLVGAVYAEEIVDLPIPIPWLGQAFDLFNISTWIELYSQTSWIGWYILISLVFSIVVLNPLIKIYEKIKEKDGKDAIKTNVSGKKIEEMK